MPDKPNKAEAIFVAALEIESPEERSVYVSATCGADARLLARVKALLEAHDHSGSFLEKPPAELAGTIVGDPRGAVRAESLQAGLASAFPIDEAVVLGDANHSVLKMLANTLNEVPSVSLRESKAEGADPIARPSSPEMPDNNSDSRYRLDGEIARGGMGAIIKGRDTDLGRDLAIKVLLDSHKDKPEVIQRFVEEAQIGGQLQHPGIAPVYELGQFADRRPFFAMKLVKGETLSTLLDDREQASDDRGKFLGIFEQVCQTMAYAHSRGVIHRDLKPANIMVGAFGEVQVMDWGLAKVLPKGGVADEKKAKQNQHGQSIIQTMRSAGSDAPGSFGSSGSDTQMGSVMGTPAYMPPEQALGEIDQMDERADVFGLGAILCEILTGKPPYASEDGTQVYRLATRGKLDDCFARLETCGADAELVRLTKHCLELEPSDRPRNAGILAGAIAGYLESVETKLREIELASVDAKVRAEELRRRQRLTLTAGAAIAATLLVGITASLWQMSRARAERDAKELALQDAENISKFLGDVFRSADPTRDGRQIKVVDLLDIAKKNLETDLADQPAQRAKLQAALGGTYHALGLYEPAISLQEQVRDHHLANSGSEHPDTLRAMNNLATSYHDAGRRDDALSMREKVRELSLKVQGKKHPDTLLAMHNLARSYYAAGRFDEALSMQEKVLELREDVLGLKHPDTLMAMNNLAFSYAKFRADRLPKLEKALSMREKVLELSIELHGKKHPHTLMAMGNLAASYFFADRRDEAFSFFEERLELSREVLGDKHPGTLRAMYSMAAAYSIGGRLPDSIEMQLDTLELRKEVLGNTHPETLEVMSRLALSYYATGRPDEELSMRANVLKLCQEVHGEVHAETISAMNSLATSYSSVGRLDEALSMREEVRDYYLAKSGPEHADTLSAMGNLADSYSDDGRHDNAISLREQVRDHHLAKSGPEHADTLRAMGYLASSYSDAGRHDNAISLREQVRDHHLANSGLEHYNTLWAMNDLARSYHDAGRLAQALTMREKVLEIRRKVLVPEHHDTIRAMGYLASSYSDAGRHDNAISLREQVRDHYLAKSGPEYATTLRAMGSLADSYYRAGRLDEAVEAWEQRFRRRPDDASAFNSAAWSVVTSPDQNGGFPGAKQAVTWARRANELKPNDDGYLNTLGVALYRAEQWQEAVDVLQTSNKSGFDRPRNWLFLAMAYWHLGETDEAQRWYDKSLALQTAHPDKLAADAELRGFYAEAAKLMSADGEEQAKPDDKIESSDADPKQNSAEEASSESTPSSTDEDDNKPESVEKSSLENTNVPR